MSVRFEADFEGDFPLHVVDVSEQSEVTQPANAFKGRSAILAPTSTKDSALAIQQCQRWSEPERR